MLDEKKGTCCGRCGHVHVKGTSCPTPFLKGASSCSKKSVTEASEVVQCRECGWDWNTQDSDESDKYICHNCGFVNTPVLAVKERLGDKGENPCWKSYHPVGLKPNGDPNCVPLDETANYCPTCLKEYLLEHKDKIEEAEYRGRKVSLGKPFLTPDGPKKRSVYVKNAKGNIVKVNFGDPNMKIKKSIPARRKSFRARHKCDTAKDRTSPRYWSCKAW